jgi:two-component system, OmpR family, flagellar system response regulator FtcR
LLTALETIVGPQVCRRFELPFVSADTIFLKNQRIKMIIIVDERIAVTQAYCSSLMREGLATTGFSHVEFADWFCSADKKDVAAIETIIIGSFPNRNVVIAEIKLKCQVPVIAVNDQTDLESMINLFSAGADDVVRKPVHAREFVARMGAIKRRNCAETAQLTIGQLKVFFDGRDPEVNGQVLIMPRRERRILEYLATNRTRRVNRAMIFNAVYGLFEEEVEESVVESHISKLRKKLKYVLGYDPIDTRRYLGYQLLSASEIAALGISQSSEHVSTPSSTIADLHLDGLAA